MPSVPTIGGGQQGASSVACSSLTMGHLIGDVSTIVSYPGIRVNQDADWKRIGGFYVKHNGEWRNVEKAYISSNGQWRETAAELQEGDPRTSVKFNLCGGFEVSGDFGGNSYMEYRTANQLYVPAGWKIKTIKFAARYDVICDGIFLGQTAALSSFLGQQKRRALILTKRPSNTYVGLAGNASGNVSSPGPQPSAWQWSTPSWAVLNLPNGQGGNMQAVRLRTPNIDGATMCGGVGGGPVSNAVLNIPDSYVLPFPVDCIVSVRYSGECGGKNRYCNHYVCDNSSYLEFESP